jgi:phosphoesterase RecJ-like protein
MSRRHRLGSLEEPIAGLDATVVCIDHHPFEEEGMADLFGVDVTAAATGLLVYELIRSRGARPDHTGALGLYVSLVTDTGSFRFSNSDSRAHRAAADLLELGLEPAPLYDAVYGNWSPGRMALTGRVLTDLGVHADGRVVVVPVSRALLAETGARPEEAEGLVDLARNRRGCECLVLLLERADGSVKASFRSQGRVDVRRVARSFGGGGHVYAAGARVAGTFDEAVARATEALVRAVEETGA